MSLTRVDKLTTEPVVGTLYLVPCVPGVVAMVGYDWMPVLLPAHADAELNVPEEHYHFDRRFMPLYPRGPNADEKYNRGQSTSVLLAAGVDVFWRRMRCNRRMADFPFNEQVVPVVEKMVAGMRLQPGCLTCPHRGVSLANLPVDEDGCVVCPGHGLRWHLESGLLVPRTAAPQR